MAPFERMGRGDWHGLLPYQIASPISQWNRSLRAYAGAVHPSGTRHTAIGFWPIWLSFVVIVATTLGRWRVRALLRSALRLCAWIGGWQRRMVDTVVGEGYQLFHPDSGRGCRALPLADAIAPRPGWRRRVAILLH